MTNNDNTKSLGFHRIGCKAVVQRHNNLQKLRISRSILEQIRDHSEKSEEIEVINISLKKINDQIDLYSRHTDRS